MSDENENLPAVIARPSGNGISRQGFGSHEIEHRRETQAAMLAERAKAEVQALFIMAERNPRDLDLVRTNLIRHCKRKRFAEVAEYAKPVAGQRIVGPSIRFVETALQEWSNVLPESSVVFDDDDKMIIRVTVTDLERNLRYSDDAVIEKFVEERHPKQGAEIVGQRTNSRGEVTYKVRANEDRLANKVAAQVSKKIRNLGLRILPADLVDEAIEVCQATRRASDAADPDAARKKLVDTFLPLGINPEHLAEYLGHQVANATTDDVDELRVVYASLKEGERWVDLLEAKRAERGEVEKPSSKANEAANKVKQKLAERKNGTKPVEPKAE